MEGVKYVRVDRADGSEEFLTREEYRLRLETIVRSDQTAEEAVAMQEQQALEHPENPVSATLFNSFAYYYVEKG